MSKKPFSHWPAVLTGPVLALVLIVFWMLDPTFLSSGKSPVALVLESPLLTFGFIILGAFFMAFLCGDFVVRVPLTAEPLVYAFCGGIAMGAGAVMASMSVNSVALFNLAGVFHLTAFMTVQGVVYVVGMIFGGLAGAGFFLKMVHRADMIRRDIALPAELKDPEVREAFFLVIMGFFFFILIATAFLIPVPQGDRENLLAALLLLIVFGAVVERGTVCMSSMLKEWFIARTAYVWRTVLFTVMCLALFYQLGLKEGVCPQFIPAEFIPHPGLLFAGSFLMGAGFVLADGCFIGTLWKIGQGSVVSVAAFIGIIVGTGIGRVLVPASPSVSDGIPNDLTLLMSPTAFLLVLWVIGGGILCLTRRRKTW